MADEPEIAPEGVQIFDSPVQPTYITSVEVSVVGNDVGLIFSTFRNGFVLTDNVPHSVARLEPSISLAMSPSSAKDLMIVLQNLVEQLESAYGPINTAFMKARSQPKE